MLPRRLTTLTLLILSPALVLSQTTPPPDCSGPEHRAFDFWVGEWDVTANNQVAGSNSITLAQAGCILHEHWTGAGGGSGESFNFYDRSTDTWNQLWIDASGNVLRLEGHYDGEMRLIGETLRNGVSIRQKLTFFKNADGSVRQFWESSRDEGKT
ncbi:MAG: hypothetical protein E4G90_03195 [Gemmatimonadales bacterium]|nr:MAG: hypothetical protein E4G90_03195 [Gemmatimonadales bacterium]